MHLFIYAQTRPCGLREAVNEIHILPASKHYCTLIYICFCMAISYSEGRNANKYKLTGQSSGTKWEISKKWLRYLYFVKICLNYGFKNNFINWFRDYSDSIQMKSQLAWIQTAVQKHFTQRYCYHLVKGCLKQRRKGLVKM